MNARAKARDLWGGGARHPGRRTLVTLLVLLALAGVIWFAVSLSHSSKSGGPGGFGGGGGGRRPATTVGVATATMADVPVTLDALGTVTPAATVTVSPQVSGVITQILFREGQTVKKGQALAVIDPRPLQMALMQAEGVLARDQAQLDNAKILLQRNQTLLAQDSIARQDVDTQQALVRQLQGTVTTDQAQVGTAKLNLSFSRVVAPVSGRVGLRVVDVGNFISAGSPTGLVVLTEVTPIDVEFTVPQDEIPRLQAQASQRKLPVTAFDRTKTVVLDQGVFSTLDNQVDTSTGTIRAKARFPNSSGKLFPSQFVNVRVSLQNLKDTVVVPVTAVRTGPNGDFVWKLNPDKTVTQVAVVKGPGTPTTSSIVQGLRPGMQVITEGGDRLTEGAAVQLPGDNGGGGLLQACAADMKTLCGGKAGRAAFQCLRQNQAKASAGCKAAMAGGGPGQGAGQAGGSPDMQGARQAAMQSCAADMKKLCPGQNGREAIRCLRDNSAKAGADCKAALSRTSRQQPQGGGQR